MPPAGPQSATGAVGAVSQESAYISLPKRKGSEKVQANTAANMVPLCKLGTQIAAPNLLRVPLFTLAEAKNEMQP